MNPIIQAIKRNSPNQLNLLLDLGHNPNKAVTDEISYIKRFPLQIAYEENRIECAKVLLNAGANPKSIIDYVIVHLVFEWCEVVIPFLNAIELSRLTKSIFLKRVVAFIELMIKKHPGIKIKFIPDMLCDALMRKHQPMAKFFISIGVDVNTADIYLATPLLHAAHNNLIETAQLLIEHDADVNYCNDLNITPLIEAAKNDATQVAKLLLEKGANIHIVDWDGFTALDYARQRNNQELITAIELNG